MADDIHNLVLSPFRDIVSKGNKAVENGTEADSQAMVKAARSLVSNAERALNKIEPVCKRQLDEYQSSFIDALKENGELSNSFLRVTTTNKPSYRRHIQFPRTAQRYDLGPGRLHRG